MVSWAQNSTQLSRIRHKIGPSWEFYLNKKKLGTVLVHTRFCKETEFLTKFQMLTCVNFFGFGLPTCLDLDTKNN